MVEKGRYVFRDKKVLLAAARKYIRDHPQLFDETRDSDLESAEDFLAAIELLAGREYGYGDSFAILYGVFYRSDVALLSCLIGGEGYAIGGPARRSSFLALVTTLASDDLELFEYCRKQYGDGMDVNQRVDRLLSFIREEGQEGDQLHMHIGVNPREKED